MSTSVIRPGVATKQTPSGKNLVMLVAGVAVAIAVGFAFYTSQSPDVTVSGVEESVRRSVQINRQNAVNSVNDEAAAYEIARLTAMGETYAANQAVQFEGVTDSWMASFEASPVATREAANAAETARLTGLAEANAAQQQAQIEAQGEFFGVVGLLGADRATQAWTDRLTGLANATVGPQALALQELKDHIMVAEIKRSQTSSTGDGHPLTVPVSEIGPSGSDSPSTYTPR